MTAPGRTVEEISAATGWPSFVVAGLLKEDRARGLVEEHDGRWRLTQRAQREFGPALAVFEQDDTEEEV